MPNSEDQVKREIENLYVSYRSVHWEEICLLILSLLPPGKLASKVFIYDKMQKWYPLDPDKNYLKSIAKALHNLYLKRLIIKEDLNTFGKRGHSRFFSEHKEKEIKLTKLVFRLPLENERVIIPQEKIVSRMFNRNSAQKK